MSAFFTPRTIVNATKIPLLGWSDRINLIRTAGAAYSSLRAGGAAGSSEKGWFIQRRSDVLLQPLDKFLPQLARQSIVPNVVDLIPEKSWCASLANFLTPKSWGLVRDVVIARAGGCEDCGALSKTECHEIWSYDEVNGIQKLIGFRAVCNECHETYHLGYAAVRDRYKIALARLVLINRIKKHEIEEFEEEIFSKYLRRSDIEWVLDLSMLAGQQLTLKGSFAQVAPNVLIGQGHMGEVEVMVSGVSVLPPRGERKNLAFA